MAAIFDLPFTPTSESKLICSIVLLDTDHEGVAVRNSLLAHIQAEISDISNVYFRFMAAMFYLPVTSMSEGLRVSPTVFLDP